MFHYLTEDQIERTVERDTNRIDRAYMAGKMSEAEYNKEMKAIDDWAKEQYKKIPRGY